MFSVVAENSWNDEQRINLQYSQLVNSICARLAESAANSTTQKEKESYLGLKRNIESTLRQKFCL